MGWQDKQIIRIIFRKLVGNKHVSISTNKLLLSMSCLCLLFWSDLVWILAGTSEWRWTNSMKSLFNMTSGSGFLWDINLFTQSNRTLVSWNVMSLSSWSDNWVVDVLFKDLLMKENYLEEYHMSLVDVWNFEVVGSNPAPTSQSKILFRVFF